MGKSRRQTPTPSDTNNGHYPLVEERGSELSDTHEHIYKLRQVMTTTKGLIGLLGDQLQGLSATIPVLRGLEIVSACPIP
jgi:hypothetical protein